MATTRGQRPLASCKGPVLRQGAEPPPRRRASAGRAICPRCRNLSDGGAVEVADLGDALIIVPAGRGGLRALVRSAIDDAGGYAGGYAALAAAVVADEPELA